MPVRGICAHRGASASHPENTIPALREAVRLGAHMIEIDLRMTRDGAVVLMHDATVDRTTDGRGRVAEMTLPRIKKLDAGRSKDLQFEGTKVPTLEEALRVLPHNCWINLHLKVGGFVLAQSVTEVLIEQDRLHQAILACGPTAAAAAREITPSVLICNLRRQAEANAYVRDSIDMRAEFIQVWSPTGSPTDWDWAWHAQQRGVRINYCCTDEPRELWRLFRAGVEFVFVDDVERMMGFARRFGIAPLRPAFAIP